MHVPTKDDLLNDRRPRRLRLGAIAAGLALTFGLAACGDDADDATTTTTDASEQTTTTEETTTTEADGAATGETVEITGVNYAFEGVPETVEPGTELSFTNASEDEVHEMVVVRIDDDETRPLEELIGLGDAAQEVVEDVGVAVALPGEDGMVVDGELVMEEPGRYALLCFIPVGADPQVLEELMANPPAEGEEPDLGDGPPHVTQGMAAELTVE